MIIGFVNFMIAVSPQKMTVAVFFISTTLTICLKPIIFRESLFIMFQALQILVIHHAWIKLNFPKHDKKIRYIMLL